MKWRAVPECFNTKTAFVHVTLELLMSVIFQLSCLSLFFHPLICMTALIFFLPLPEFVHPLAFIYAS